MQEEAKQTDKQIRGELDGENGRKQGFSADHRAAVETKGDCPTKQRLPSEQHGLSEV